MNAAATNSDLAALRSIETDTPAQKRARAENVAGKFEAIFVQQFVAGMRRTAALGEDSALFGSGPGSDTYAQWFDQHLSGHLLQNGGLGVRDTLLRDWERLGQIPAQKQEEATQGEIDVQA